MRTLEKRSQVVVISTDNYKVVFNSKEKSEAVQFAASIRKQEKTKGNKVITNTGFYEA